MSFDKRKVIATIESALSDLRYGSIEITVHDGRVVQIERKEKVRIESSHSNENQGQSHTQR